MNNEIIMPNETLVVTCRIHTPIKNILKVGDVVTTPCKDYYNFFVHYATELSRHYECFIPTMLGEKEIAKMNAEIIKNPRNQGVSRFQSGEELVNSVGK